MTLFKAETWTPARLGLTMGCLTGLAVVLTLGGPGLTIDEPLDVRPARTYVQTLRDRGFAFFERSTVDRVFADNAEHPPLGRWLLGLASTLGEPLETQWLGPDPVRLYILSARMAPALAFAVLVGLIVQTSARRYGRLAGIAAGYSLSVMPRDFAHAHLGALDTFIALFWTLALLGADRALTSRRPRLAMAAAGLLWGLALLTKIHAWILIPVVLLWSFVRLGKSGIFRTLIPFALWILTGLLTFFVGWPWLWYDTLPRFLQFLGTGVDRASIHVLYLGTIYLDRDLPWHYPWFYFAVTVPIGLHLFGVMGVVTSWNKRGEDLFPVLLLASIGLFLGIFSTRIPVYDGERLFLVVFPLWAIIIGRGISEVWKVARQRLWRKLGLIAILSGQAYGVIALHPFGLSYYNLLVGGLPGAERLGLELTYWGDAVDGRLLDRLVRLVPPGDSTALVPTLYPGQGILSTTRAMARNSVLLGDEETVARTSWVVVSRRSAYWRPDFRERFAGAEVHFQRRRQGVWLSAIARFPPQGRPSRNVQTSP